MKKTEETKLTHKERGYIKRKRDFIENNGWNWPEVLSTKRTVKKMGVLYLKFKLEKANSDYRARKTEGRLFSDIFY